jgi:hypothetical protein
MDTAEFTIASGPATGLDTPLVFQAWDSADTRIAWAVERSPAEAAASRVGPTAEVPVASVAVAELWAMVVAELWAMVAAELWAMVAAAADIVKTDWAGSSRAPARLHFSQEEPCPIIPC